MLRCDRKLKRETRNHKEILVSDKIFSLQILQMKTPYTRAPLNLLNLTVESLMNQARGDEGASEKNLPGEEGDNLS